MFVTLNLSLLMTGLGIAILDYTLKEKPCDVIHPVMFLNVEDGSSHHGIE
jgi:hypothetical protein